MKKVLAIVENPQVDESIQNALADDQYYLMVEKSGFEGILTAKAEKPDIIICDFDLPDMAGTEILNEMGSYGLLTFSPFIFLIGDNWDKNSSAVMDSDMDAIIKQSIVEKDLVSVINQAVTNKLNHIDALNQAQHEFNESFIGYKEDREHSSEEMRKKLLIIQKLFPIIKLGRMSLNTGIEILDQTDADLDEKILDANRFINIGRSIEKQQNIYSSLQNIWLIDDDPTQNLLNRIILKQNNPEWKISEFNDANRAFQALSIRKPDLVFLDINMPGMSGFEFLKKLTANKINLNVIMLSSSVSADEIRRSFGFEQVINYLTKPIKKEKVKNLLRGSYFKLKEELIQHSQ